ncbi:MAG: gamma-glutamylcyclotransferase [candidate division KSB1 bacterium]|nr:gamma-glutamylcyclotransferase [candidate division KSB1 bacterium]MDZ7368930.1 gamma-glutamylcyclotransferase [candidate division KSB1 bacterium]MDZ7406918.1 gamma-glutamylcyclotransferase [candidate division KSB1 bacterium]
MDSLESHNLLFVYGSLMRGMERGHFLSEQKAKFLSTAAVAGALYALGDFPGLVLDIADEYRSAPTSQAAEQPSSQPHSERRLIHGELFEIFDPLTFFETLDVIEGYWPDHTERSLFVRKLIPVQTGQGEIRAWAYILNLPVNGLSKLS